MVMRIQTGSGTSEKWDGEIRGTNGGPSPNNREIAGMVSSESPNVRLLAFMKIIGSPQAVAYLAATAEHGDVREAARKEMLARGLHILNGMAGRTLEPWEKEVVRLMREGLDGYNGWDKVLIDAKLMQIEKGKKFDAYDTADGVAFVDESPVEFDSDRLARILDSSKA